MVLTAPKSLITRHKMRTGRLGDGAADGTENMAAVLTATTGQHPEFKISFSTFESKKTIT